ncbi:MAG: hypothetical protein V3U07_00990 [Nitrospirales bacterium]|jgi:hypothetical protein
MKKVFYISTKPVYDWDFIVPSDNKKNTCPMDISILLMQDGLGQKNLPTSSVRVLNSGDEQVDSKTSEGMSYQEFLEEIFSNDLVLVI